VKEGEQIQVKENQSWDILKRHASIPDEVFSSEATFPFPFLGA
jgi:hypothetical protein